MKSFFQTLAAGAVGGILAFGAFSYFQNEPKIQNAAAPVARQVNFESAAGPGFDFTRAAEKAMPAVVHIKASESRQAAQRRGMQQRQANPFSFFFGEDFMSPFEQYSQPRAGTGSGVIYSSDGYIITNNHVVDFADEFEVTLFDNREFKARLVGKDDLTDLAVIKIDASGLQTMEIGNSDATRVGEWCLAVGNPFDLTSTVTAGIVSAKGRDIDIIKGAGAIESFIQTDAAVNPGNSGGALVDLNGRLIGINTAIASQTGTFAGYAFAIPVDFAVKVANDLIQYGSYKRAFLGVDIFDLDDDAAQELGVDFTQGVVVQKVYPDGSAQAAGLRANDVIVSANGKNIRNVAELREVIGRAKQGETIDFGLFRASKKVDLPVKMRARTSG